ncbi:MAG: MoaD/ThiS family protein [Dehalococcoidia bacterium]|nr:MoaD/ThiS family protein [Dehalococcoidia bacterium]MQG00519.1 MoaD/ThiS family protein [SAR202 cluster bacterium]|tara:strand:- start:1313 stop:1591 length:279 start_codon:yes stop_codon:yes gene_type:complete
MSTVVRIPTPLRRVTNGDDKASVDGDNLSEIINDLESQYPGIKERLCDENEELRHFVNIYINGEDVRFLNGLQTNVSEGDEISIVPAVAGGT